MKFRDLVDQLVAERVAELAAEAGEEVRAAGREAAAARRAEYSDAAAARRTEHETELAEHWAIADVVDAQRIIREFHGGSATRWLADEAGLAARTARRWMSPDVPPSRVARVIALAEQLVAHLTLEFEAGEEAEASRLEADEARHAADVEQAAAEAEAAAAARARSAGATLIAPVVASYGSAHVGAGVEVAYDDDPRGERDIHEQDVDFAPIAAALAADDVGLADELFDEAVLDAYGDLGNTLTIRDYPGGITLR